MRSTALPIMPMNGFQADSASSILVTRSNPKAQAGDHPPNLGFVISDLAGH
jgi:hypothetical protein